MTQPGRRSRMLAELAELDRNATLRQLGTQINTASNKIADPFQLRMGTVVSPLIDVGNYNVQVSGDGVTRQMKSISEFAPVVGDPVWVAQLGPHYLVLGLRSGPYHQAAAEPVVFATVAAVSGAPVTWPVPYTVAPTVRHSVQAGGNFDIVSNMQSVSNTGATFRLWRPGGGNINGTVFLHWEAIGV